MTIDVSTEVEIGTPRGEVAAYVSDPDRATVWQANIAAVEWQTPKPVRVGSKIAFVAQFLGRRLAYVYEIKEIIAGERCVMATTDGPFAMETTYTWDDAAIGATKMRIRNRGEPSGFPRLLLRLWPGPCVVPTVRISRA